VLSTLLPLWTSITTHLASVLVALAQIDCGASSSYSYVSSLATICMESTNDAALRLLLLPTLDAMGALDPFFGLLHSMSSDDHRAAMGLLQALCARASAAHERLRAFIVAALYYLLAVSPVIPRNLQTAEPVLDIARKCLLALVPQSSVERPRYGPSQWSPAMRSFLGVAAEVASFQVDAQKLERIVSKFGARRSPLSSFDVYTVLGTRPTAGGGHSSRAKQAMSDAEIAQIVEATSAILDRPQSPSPHPSNTSSGSNSSGSNSSESSSSGESEHGMSVDAQWPNAASVGYKLTAADVCALHACLVHLESGVPKGEFRQQAAVGSFMFFKSYRCFLPPEEIPYAMAFYEQELNRLDHWHSVSHPTTSHPIPSGISGSGGNGASGMLSAAQMAQMCGILKRAYYAFAALVYYIHPFEDGNGRIARLVACLVLRMYGCTTLPISSSDKLLSFAEFVDKVANAGMPLLSYR
jgi:hypothetical protein